MSRIESFSLVIFCKAKKKRLNPTRFFVDFHKNPVIFYEKTVIFFNLMVLC